MTEVWNDFLGCPEIILLEESDVENLFYKEDMAEKFMQKYGAKVGSQYYIEKEKFLQIIRQAGNILADEK